MDTADEIDARRRVLEMIKKSLSDLPPKTVAGQMRVIYDLIEQRLAAGVRKMDIVAELNRLGITVSKNTFDTTLKRLRRHRRGRMKPRNQKSANVSVGQGDANSDHRESRMEVYGEQRVKTPKEHEQLEEFSAFNRPIPKKRT